MSSEAIASRSAAPSSAPKCSVLLPAGLQSGLSRSHLPSLDGLRALAAFAVVFYHYGISWCPAGLGVLAFFVLSGFLITWLLLKEEERHGQISLRSFYIRRSLRVFPAFYVYWFLIAGLALWLHRPILTPQAIASFFYLSNYYQAIFGDPNTGLSHTWSLGVEEQFYLLWPLAFLLLRDNKKRVQFLALMIAAVWIYREVLVFVVHRDQGYIYEAFDTRVDHPLLGCLLAVILRSGRMPGLWRRLCSTPLWAWLTLALLVLSATVQNLSGTTYRDAVGFIVDPLLVAILLAQTIASRDAGLGKLLNLPWLRYLGTISYSVYLYQQIVIGPIKKITHPWPWLSPIAAVLGVILFASGSYWLIEKPFLKLKDRFSRVR